MISVYIWIISSTIYKFKRANSISINFQNIKYRWFRKIFQLHIYLTQIARICSTHKYYRFNF